MKQVGIWIDKREAKIISLKDGSEKLETIASNIEDFHVSGGSGTKLKGGPQDVVQDSKFLERERHQLAKYFKSLTKYMADAESVVIFGPAQTGSKFNNELSRNHPLLKSKVKSVEKTDNMTENQLKAWFIDYYSSVK